MFAVFLSGLMAVSSLYTGNAEDLPQWNGWDYFVFCAMEGATLGIILGAAITPVAFLGVLLLPWFHGRLGVQVLNSPDHKLNDGKGIPE